MLRYFTRGDYPSFGLDEAVKRTVKASLITTTRRLNRSTGALNSNGRGKLDSRISLTHALTPDEGRSGQARELARSNCGG